MSYLGRGLEQVDNISKLDNITFNGGTTYALTKDSAAFTPISSNAILISIDGVVQQGNFSVSGTNIVFNFSPTSSNTCDFIMHYGTGVAFTPADSSITKDKTDFISTSSSAGLQIKGDGTTDGTLQLNCSQNSHGIKLKSPNHASSSSYTLTFPATDPAADKMLQTDSSGNLSFVDAPSGNLVKIHSGSVSAGDGYVALTNKFSSTYKIYKIFLYDWNTSQDSEVRLRWLTGGSGYVESGANTYQYAGVGFNTDGQGSSWSGSNDYGKITGETVRHDADEHFAWEGTLYNPAGTTLKKRLVFAGGGRRTGNYGFNGHGTLEWNSTTAITGVRFFTSAGTFDSLSFAIYGIVT